MGDFALYCDCSPLKKKPYNSGNDIYCDNCGGYSYYLKQDCLICQNKDIDYYNIMKTFCSNMDDIVANICDNHKEALVKKGLEFINK